MRFPMHISFFCNAVFAILHLNNANLSKEHNFEFGIVLFFVFNIVAEREVGGVKYIV